MFQKTNSKLLFSLLMLICLSIGFYSCEQDESLDTQEPQVSKSLFKQHLEDNTQTFIAEDLGKGKYTVTGEQGTKINIDNALVNSAGDRVRGNVDIVLIEIYSVSDMILNKKQTLANYDGQIEILESGGEVFVKVYQDGEELFADGKGEMTILLPTENTGGARDDMELYYGEEVGDQVMWYPTGQEVKVVNSESRAEENYIVLIQDFLGWINVDVIYKAGGDPVECVEVKIDCEELCQGEQPLSTTVAIHIPTINSAFELTYDPASNSYKYCGDQAPLTIGGLNVTFIVIVECPDGSLFSSFVSVKVKKGYHLENINCENISQTELGQLEEDLQSLL